MLKETGGKKKDF